MIPVNPEALKPFASKYVWWKTPDEAVAMPERVIAQVMNMGDYADVQTLAVQVGDDALREVLKHAEAGQFNERSWAYWHYRPGLACAEVCVSGVFKPRMDILPPAQQRLWPALRPAADLGFVLYGGTAVALRLGHRASVDFDFFSERPLDRDAIRAAFPFVE